MPLGPALLGRVLDGSGKPLDGLPFPDTTETGALITPPFNPLQRTPIEHVLDTGVRPINALLTVGRGQRMGLFAGSGVGKSVLLGMMARYTRADVIVVGLIGERGREVKDFIENILGAEGRARSVVIAAPADVSPLLRMQGAAYATRIAEDFRDRGQHVLLIMDSLTRYAMAQREIALAIGEPPATKGYPPSVFAKLPALVERAGNGISGGGSITAFYTVLTEGDDQQDPIADSARAILDGHIVLSRRLAEAGHYPAIDIEASISRAMTALISEQHYARVRTFKQLLSSFQRNRDLVSVGAYAKGSDPMLDKAIALWPQLEGYLQQGILNARTGKRLSWAGAYFPDSVITREITADGGTWCAGDPERSGRKEVEDAARLLGEMRRGCQQAEEQLKMLIDYQNEYRNNLNSDMSAGMTSNRWINYQQFIQTLESHYSASPAT